MKKKRCKIVFLGIAVLLAGVLAFAVYNKPEKQQIVARINGMDVSADELNLFLKSEIDSTDVALKELTPYKIIQKELKDLGLIEDFSYPKLIEEMQAENENRRRKKENGEVIYGPVEYTPKTYYEEYRKLWEQERKQVATDEELRELYDSHTDWFVQFGTTVLECIIIPSDEMTKEEAVLAVDGVKRRMGEGSSLKEATVTEGLEAYLQQRTFTGADLSSEMVTMYPEIEDNIYNLAVGSWSKVIENEGYEWIFLYCESREETKRQTFEESREALEAYWEEEYLENLLQKLSDEAEVEILKPTTH